MTECLWFTVSFADFLHRYKITIDEFLSILLRTGNRGYIRAQRYEIISIVVGQ